MKPKTEKLLDEEFSRFIRMKYADKNGLVTCFTCGKVHNWKSVDNGHWQLRKNLATRWNPDNCRPQCITCNQFKEGLQEKFENNLIRTIGQTRVDEVFRLAHTQVKISEPEAQAMLQSLKQQNKELEKKFL